MKGASLVLATSLETERVLRRMGARRTEVVFPDAYDQPVDAEAVLALRRKQADRLTQCIRLLWQGRPRGGRDRISPSRQFDLHWTAGSGCVSP